MPVEFLSVGFRWTQPAASTPVASGGADRRVRSDPAVPAGSAGTAERVRVGPGARGRRRRLAAALIVVVSLMGLQRGARADEGGASFWVPGQFAANLAATPPSPGWSIPLTAYYYSGRAPATASAAAAVAPGTHSQTWQLSASPTYAPETKLLGGQLAFMLSVGLGGDATQLDQAAPGPGSQTVRGPMDLSPAATWSWQRGAESWAVYVTGNVPVGSYDSQRLSNVGLGHAAIDGGGIYTYESPTSGHSVSAAAGVTYNFINRDTEYRSGIDSHLGLSAMLPLSNPLRAGLSGYVYYQLTGDGGSGNGCGPCKSRVAGIGPQLNYTFTVAGQQWTANLRGYCEFWARNRLEGYAMFATLAIPVGGQP
jgi:hypothetical protein